MTKNKKEPAKQQEQRYEFYRISKTKSENKISYI